jgi:hypothetical protein
VLKLPEKIGKVVTQIGEQQGSRCLKTGRAESSAINNLAEAWCLTRVMHTPDLNLRLAGLCWLAVDVTKPLVVGTSRELS